MAVSWSEPLAWHKEALTINTMKKEEWVMATFYKGTQEVSFSIGKIGLKNKENV